MTSFTSLVVGDACQLGYLSFPHLDFIRRTAQISCCPSVCSPHFLSFSIILQLLIPRGAWNIFLIFLIQFSGEGCGYLMPFCSSYTMLDTCCYLSSYFFSPLILTASITFGTSLYFCSVSIHALEWNFKIEKHGKFYMTKCLICTVLIFVLWFSAEDYLTSMSFKGFSFIFYF